MSLYFASAVIDNPLRDLAGEVRQRVQQRPLLGREAPLRRQQSYAADGDTRLVRGRRHDLQVAL
jgi:hypothetical protein